MKGFLAIPSAVFRRIGGYDEVLEGYAAGGDTDLADRLKLVGIARHWLDASMIESVVEHDNADRTRHHLDPIATSYCAGLLYRSAKLALLRIVNRVQLPLATRRNLYDAAKTAARKLGAPSGTVSMMVNVNTNPILMPRQLGYEKGTQ
ncbi:MAG TPA: hypothetical protein VMN38_06585 [Sphingomicrobium sp.]|nr:hypothetical protein [Sphingomicrobium sp.]